MQIAKKSWAMGLMLAASVSFPVAAQNVTADTVLATVGGVDITLGHLIVARTTLPEQYQQLPDDVLYTGLLDQLVQQNALAQSLTDVTTATTLTIENQRTGLLAGEALGRIAQGALSDEALQAAYDAKFAQAEPETEFNASHILVETEDQAKALKVELDGGADFGELAKEKSTGPSGPSGGALGWFAAGMMVPEFETAVQSMEPGQVSDPVQTQFGWHVIILNETRIKDAPPLEQVRNELAQEIQQAAVAAHIEEVMSTADVTRPEIEVDPAVLRDMSLVSN